MFLHVNVVCMCVSLGFCIGRCTELAHLGQLGARLVSLADLMYIKLAAWNWRARN